MQQQIYTAQSQRGRIANLEMNSYLPHLLWSFIVCMLLCSTFNAQAENANRIVKWKDEKGVTHYGDKIPTQYINQESSEINKQGVTVKHHKPVSSQDQAIDLAKREQDKKDKALLGAYTNAEEIDLARDRNVQLDLIALESLNQEKITQQKKLSANKKLAENYTKRKKPVPEDLTEAISNNQKEIVQISQRTQERKQIIEKTRQRFDENKKRYLELKGLDSSGSSPAQTTPETQTTPATSPHQ